MAEALLTHHWKAHSVYYMLLIYLNWAAMDKYKSTRYLFKVNNKDTRDTLANE